MLIVSLKHASSPMRAKEMDIQQRRTIVHPGKSSYLVSLNSSLRKVRRR